MSYLIDTNLIDTDDNPLFYNGMISLDNTYSAIDLQYTLQTTLERVYVFSKEPFAHITANPLWIGLPILLVVIAMSFMLVQLLRNKQNNTGVRKILNAMPEAVALFDSNGRLTALNRKLEGLMPSKLKPSVFRRTSTNDLYAQLSPDTAAIEKARIQAREAADDADSTITFEVPSFDHKSLTVKERPTGDGGTAVSVYGVVDRPLKRQYDQLTGLPGRVALLHELANRCSHTRGELALMIVDIRSFRQINDIYGRQAGDELLNQAALCLRQYMPEDAFIARTVGDEFAVLIEADRGRPFIEECGSNLLQVLLDGLKVNDLNIPVRASAGVAYAPEHGNTVSSLLSAADSACAHAKHLGDDTFVVYNCLEQRQTKYRHQLEVGLQKAIEKNQLALKYQPQVDIKTKKTCGMEALIRWNSDQYGDVSPADFIPIAEQTGIIHQLGNWVLERAISDHQQLARVGMSTALLSVNLSRKQFEAEHFVPGIIDTLERTGFDPRTLCFEITETALARDTDRLHKQLFELTSLGVRLSIDDFGVGYSSLRELRDFPISEVKIDRTFISNIVNDQHSQDIVSAVVDISRSIGASVVAEGIETQQQFDKVAQLHCDRAQGFFFCEPIAATTLSDVISRS